MSSIAVGLLLTGCNKPPVDQPPIVDAVVDGDTIVVVVHGHRETVRLLGVDTPETSDPNRPKQCFGAEATSYVAALLPPGTIVRLERDVEARDRYGRILAYVFRSDDNAFVNAQLLARGFADLVIYPPNEAYRSELTHAYTSARTQEAGLWGHCGGPDVAIDPPLPSA